VLLNKVHHIIPKIFKIVSICSVQIDQVYVYACSLDFTDLNLLLDCVCCQIYYSGCVCVCNCTFVIWQLLINVIFFCAYYLLHFIFTVHETIVYPFTWLKNS